MSASEVQALERKAQTYRDYPVELKAAVIAAIEQNGGNVLATSKLFNLPPDTVRYWWANSDRFREIQTASVANLADKLEDLAQNTADSMTEHDLSVVTYADKARALGIVIDKMQLLRGQPTEIAVSASKVDLTVTLTEALSDVIDVTPTDNS